MCFLFWGRVDFLMEFVFVGFILIGAVGLIGIGFALEANTRKPILQNPQNDSFFDVDNLNQSNSHTGTSELGSSYGFPFLERFQTAVKNHPVPAYGVFETLFWVLMLIPLIDHVFHPQNSTISQVIWMLTIGPHEIGHVICIPFGRFLTIAGGSIWQILWWLGLALYTYGVKRYISFSLVLWMITAHSFINLSVYIGDAEERNLPLLFGLGKDSHDWGNLLETMGLVQYDDMIATLSVIIGVMLGIVVILAGILTTWLIPRTKLVSLRLEQSPLRRILSQRQTSQQ